MAGMIGDILRTLHRDKWIETRPIDGLCDKPKCRKKAIAYVNGSEHYPNLLLGVGYSVCETDIEWARNSLGVEARKRGHVVKDIEVIAIKPRTPTKTKR